MKKELLTDAQWQRIEKYLTETRRSRKHSLRSIMDGLFYVLKTGCQWRMLPANFPKWELVYYYFSKWRDSDLFVYLNDMLREHIRTKENRNAQCSVVIIDSQSVKTTRKGGFRGFDGNKRINGRKRHVIVDTMGNMVSNLVHTANIHDSKAAGLVIRNLRENIQGIKLIYADCGYRGELGEKVRKAFGYTLKISPKIKDDTNGKISPKRWIVERTFSWLENFRRLSKDFEFLLESSQAMLYLASIKLLLNKI
jgi:putative transposase